MIAIKYIIHLPFGFVRCFNIQRSWLSEVAGERKCSVSRCHQLWIILNNNCIGKHTAVIFRVALFECESHREIARTAATFGRHKAWLILIIEVSFVRMKN